MTSPDQPESIGRLPSTFEAAMDFDLTDEEGVAGSGGSRSHTGPQACH
jgi:hypothetical protein